MNWNNITQINSQQFTCWKCGSAQASDKGWKATDNKSETIAYICICHLCHHPTYLSDGRQTPGIAFGSPVDHVDDPSVQQLYDEARNAMKVSSYTAVVLACRKLLMHVAVSKGAHPGDTFVSYVQYLATNHYIPRDAEDWVDHIRKRGNEANHEIVIMDQAAAEELITFSEMLLKLIYEFPGRMQTKHSDSDGVADN